MAIIEKKVKNENGQSRVRHAPENRDTGFYRLRKVLVEVFSWLERPFYLASNSAQLPQQQFNVLLPNATQLQSWRKKGGETPPGVLGSNPWRGCFRVCAVHLLYRTLKKCWEQTHSESKTSWLMVGACCRARPHENRSPPWIRISMALAMRVGLLLLHVLAAVFRPSRCILCTNRFCSRPCFAIPGTRDLGATEATSLSRRMTSRRTGMSASRPSMRWSCGRSSSAASTRTVSRSRRRSSK